MTQRLSTLLILGQMPALLNGSSHVRIREYWIFGREDGGKVNLEQVQVIIFETGRGKITRIFFQYFLN